MTYVEGNRYVSIPIEHLSEPYEMAIYLDSAHGWMIKGQPVGEIDQAELNVIRERIQECLTYLNRRFTIRH